MYKNGSKKGLSVETTAADWQYLTFNSNGCLTMIAINHSPLQYIYHAACLAERQTVNPQTLQQLPVQSARRTI
jgi:hypothetical protein